jgi:hypothetical protein
VMRQHKHRTAIGRIFFPTSRARHHQAKAHEWGRTCCAP